MSDTITFSKNTFATENCATETCASEKPPALIHKGLFSCKEERAAFVLKFKALTHAKSLTASHMLLYCLLMGKDAGKAFTPITNSVKLANGAKANEALTLAKYALMGMQTDRTSQFSALKRLEESQAKCRIGLSYQRNIDRQKEIISEPLPVMALWGCSDLDALDFGGGLSMATFRRAQEVCK